MNNEKHIIPDDGDRLMSISEAAARLRTSPNVVRRLIEKKFLVPICNGQRKYIRKYTLNGFLAQIDGKDIMELVADKGVAANG